MDAEELAELVKTLSDSKGRQKFKIISASINIVRVKMDLSNSRSSSSSIDDNKNLTMHCQAMTITGLRLKNYHLASWHSFLLAPINRLTGIIYVDMSS